MSQKKSENQRQGASHSGGETQRRRASHSRGETHRSRASQNASETQDATANKQKPLRPRKYPYLHALQRTLYDLQGVRIRAGNRMDALANTCASCGKRKKRDEGPECECFAPLVTPDQHTGLVKLVGTVADDMERALEKPIKAALKDVPIFEWLSRIKGIGPRLAASLIAVIDPISLFDTVSSLWAYGGLNPEAEGYNYNWELKCLACEKLPTQFIKQGDFYRDLYERIKAQYQAKHPEPVDTGELTKAGKPKMKYTPIHIERMTRRKLGKIFLQHLWVKWRGFEGLPVSDPWIIAHGGHVDYIAPPE